MDSMNYKNDTDFIVQVTLIRRGSKMFSYDIDVGTGNADVYFTIFKTERQHP